MFVSRGVYSVPAWGPVGQYAEWYGYFQRQPGSPTQAFHNKTYGPEFPYAAFAPLWKAELFNAQKWAETIVKSGAKYVVPTSKVCFVHIMML
jgi:alpha-L-fucosidase